LCLGRLFLLNSRYEFFCRICRKVAIVLVDIDANSEARGVGFGVKLSCIDIALYSEHLHGAGSIAGEENGSRWCVVTGLLVTQ